MNGENRGEIPHRTGNEKSIFISPPVFVKATQKALSKASFSFILFSRLETDLNLNCLFQFRTIESGLKRP